MSHTVEVDVGFTDEGILKEACDKLGIGYKEGLHTVKQFQGNVSCKLSFQLPGWNYPVAVCEDGKVKYDNYNGAWGRIEELQKLQDQYSRCVTEDELSFATLGEEHVDEETGELTLVYYDYS